MLDPIPDSSSVLHYANKRELAYPQHCCGWLVHKPDALHLHMLIIVSPAAKRGDNALTLSLMRLDAAYFLLDNVKVAASVAAKHMASVHIPFKHYASPHGNKAARFIVGAILARLHGKEVQAAIAEDPHLCGKQQPWCGWPEQERFASEWLALHLDLVYERVQTQF